MPVVEDKIFDTDTKRKRGVSFLTDLSNHPGWALLKQIIQVNIDLAKDQICEMEEVDENKAELLRLRSLLKAYTILLTLPDKTITDLGANNNDEVKTDPYYQTRELGVFADTKSKDVEDDDELTAS